MPHANAAAVEGQLNTSPEKIVLIVDDDDALRNSLAFILSIEGYKVRTYASGRELLDDTNLPERGCLVIDQKLPGSDGLTVIATLRARSVQLPAVLITTNPTPFLRQRAEQANVAIVEKPLLTGALFHRIDAALK